jgi:hypothetical protein
MRVLVKGRDRGKEGTFVCIYSFSAHSLHLASFEVRNSWVIPSTEES